jgi:peptide/nickel transport system ATP-binding protein
VRNLRVEFPTRRGTLVALDDVSFDIHPGEVLGVVGESGAGKSMTGAAIIGLLEPPGRIAGGTISLGGRRIDNLPYKEMRTVRGRQIGAIFQDPLTTLNPLYTIGRQLVETMTTHLPLNPAEARKKAIEWLELVGIPAAAQRIDSYPHEFSGGMRQRVVIALALCAEPKLIVADEPTTALDVTVQKQILKLIAELQARHGTALLFVTHDLGVVSKVCQSLSVLYGGLVVESTKVRDFFREPAHAYSRALLAATPKYTDPDASLTPVPEAVIAAVQAEVAAHDRSHRHG